MEEKNFIACIVAAVVLLTLFVFLFLTYFIVRLIPAIEKKIGTDDEEDKKEDPVLRQRKPLVNQDI